MVQQVKSPLEIPTSRIRMPGEFLLLCRFSVLLTHLGRQQVRAAGVWVPVIYVRDPNHFKLLAQPGYCWHLWKLTSRQKISHPSPTLYYCHLFGGKKKERETWASLAFGKTVKVKGFLLPFLHGRGQGAEATEVEGRRQSHSKALKEQVTQKARKYKGKVS